MTLEFILIQLLGIIAWLFIILSYHRENTNKILIFQIIGTFIYGIHYLLLGAYSGLLICVVSIFFDYGYYKTTKDKYIYIVSIPVRILCGLVSYNTIVDLLPIFASLIDGYSLTKGKKIVVIGAIISYSCWVIYDMSVGSYSGALTDGLIALSNISILLFNYDFLARKEKKNK